MSSSVETPFQKSDAASSSPLVSLAVDVVGHVLDVIRAQLLTESRHGAVAVGDLGDDGLDVVLAVLDESFLLKLLLRHNGIISSGVAGSAVAIEDSLTVLQVRSESWSASGHGDQKPQGCTDSLGSSSRI